jgi:hypothetical protein
MVSLTLDRAYSFAIGSDIECQFELNRFGILPSSLPVKSHGGIDLSFHYQWMQRQRAIEDGAESITASVPSESREETVVSSDSDLLCETILFGRGRPVQNHPGNVHFRKMLEPYADQYDNARRSQRAAIAAAIVQKVLMSGSRFLKQADNMHRWVVVDEEEAIKKVCQCFRTLRGKR